MNESTEQQTEDVPHEDELDVEGPNESAPGHNPDEDDSAGDDDG